MNKHSALPKGRRLRDGFSEAGGVVAAYLIGFDIQQPTPSWGNLIDTAQDHFIKNPWLAMFPGMMIFITIISVNDIGDGLRQAFDPYKLLETVGEYT